MPSPDFTTSHVSFETSYVAPAMYTGSSANAHVATNAKAACIIVLSFITFVLSLLFCKMTCRLHRARVEVEDAEAVESRITHDANLPRKREGVAVAL